MAGDFEIDPAGQARRTATNRQHAKRPRRVVLLGANRVCLADAAHTVSAKHTVYFYFKTFRRDGTWERIPDLLGKRVRVKHGKSPQPHAGILDSQAVKTTEKRGTASATMRAKG